MGTAVANSETRTQIIRRKVCLRGIKPVMFDRYPGDNNTKLEWWQKVYLDPKTNAVSLPVINISSLLSAHNTNSAPKRLRDKRKYKDIANACLSFVSISSVGGGEFIPFHGENDKPVLMGTIGPNQEVDPVSGISLHHAVARLDKGIPNPKFRPVLPRPWTLTFIMEIFPNKEIKEQEVKNLLEEAGLAIGIGTFRGVFGKFVIDEWSEFDG
jgi:hypothetical protein